MGKHKRETKEDRFPIVRGEISCELASEQNGEDISDETETGKLKLSDKIWVGLVIAAFVIGFILIVVYDLF